MTWNSSPFSLTTSRVATTFTCWTRAAMRASSKNMVTNSGSFVRCECIRLMATVREKPTGPSNLPTWTVAIPPAPIVPQIA